VKYLNQAATETENCTTLWQYLMHRTVRFQLLCISQFLSVLSRSRSEPACGGSRHERRVTQAGVSAFKASSGLGSTVHTPAAHDLGIRLLGSISRLVMLEVEATGRGEPRRWAVVVAYLSTSRWFVETCVKYKLKYKHKGSMATASCIVGYCLLY